MLSNAALDRLADLENEARLADLEIERTPLKDVGNLDIQNMTAGEIITLANVMEAVRVLSDTLKPSTSVPAKYASPATSERRGGDYDDDEEAMDKLRAYLTERLSEEPTVPTVSGPVKLSDVPRDENGAVIKEWLEANCTCDDHERKRIEADRQKSIGDPSIAAGLYL